MKKILIIEDDPDSAEMLSMLLEFQGHLVKCAKFGHMGISLASTFNPDVVITDLGMPDIEWSALVRELRGVTSTTGSMVIALTGQDSADIRREVQEAGVDYFFVKGDEISNLLSVIDQPRDT